MKTKPAVVRAYGRNFAALWESGRVDDTGDRKDGIATAHVARQYLGSVGKVDNGIVAVTSLWADARCYWPVRAVPYTPASRLPGGERDPGFKTKPQLGQAMVKRALAAGVPFGWVTGDTVYGFYSNAGKTFGAFTYNPYDFVQNPNPIFAIWDAGGTLVYVLGIGAPHTRKREEELKAQFPELNYLALSELFGGPLLTEFSRSLTRLKVQQYQRFFGDAEPEAGSPSSAASSSSAAVSPPPPERIASIRPSRPRRR